MTVRELELAVQRMLEEAKSPSPENAISAVELRTNVNEFLEELGESFARSPQKAQQVHWAMWTMDVDESAPATFALAVLHPDRLDLAAGQGEAAALHDFSDGGYAGPAEGVIDALAQHATLAPTRIAAPKMTAHAWASFE